MTEICGRTKVVAPVEVVRAHWQRVESFPEFMLGVRAVRREAGELTTWRLDDQEITVRVKTSDRGISWSTVDGPKYEVVVLWRALPGGRTRLTWRIWVDEDSELGTPKELAVRFQGDLERFADRMVSIRGLRIDHGEAWLKDPCGGRQPVAL
ncbi:hypothetical protein [Allokutzneria sp. NRRL B-24872]|uniref:hypothetical protein n=1 Tax=Allokutzneria sp. NRRL B-24872 TaxID=1137961 RepID=UPI000A3AB3B5|nr:hypothetical protein [Allokutzneria sp. NRRL B-24872]